MKDYTAAQKRAIDLGFSEIRALVETYDHSMAPRFARAVKDDKGQRGSFVATKGLFCEAFIQGYDGTVRTISDLHGYAPGPQQLVIIGATVRERGEHRTPDDEIIANIRAGAAAMEESIRTRFDNLSEGE